MSVSKVSAEAEAWFLQRGLPTVLTTRGRWRRLWSRSAPVLAACATFQSCGIPLYLITGTHEVRIEGLPAGIEWVVVAIVVAALPVSVLVGWLMPRLPRTRLRAAAGITAAVVLTVAGDLNAGPASLLQSAVVVAAVLILTGLGVGSVLGWAVRITLSHLASVGALAVRALPVVLLTALVFFNTYVWIMAATINGKRLLLAMVFLVSIAAAFVISATVERVKPMLRSSAVVPADSERLADTPFAAMPDPEPDPDGSDTFRPTRIERLNVVFVLATSQLVQISVVAALTGTIYLVLGLIVLTPELLKEWTHLTRSDAIVLGWTVPVPDSLIHMSLFLGALTLMYVSARAVGDGDYRSTFLDPRIEDLHAALIARNRYRNAMAAAGRADPANISDVDTR
jgi:MFS family permease